MNAPRMRTIKQAIAELKAADSGTAFTENALRCAIARGDIPVVVIGAKRLVNMETLEQYLSGTAITPKAETFGGIRRIV